MLCIFVLSLIFVGMVDSTTGHCCKQIYESNRATAEPCCKQISKANCLLFTPTLTGSNQNLQGFNSPRMGLRRMNIPS